MSEAVPAGVVGRRGVGVRPRVQATIRVAWSWIVDHPVLTIAFAGVLFVVMQTAWIARARHLGGFDVDEAGGVAAALRFHRSLGLDPRPLLEVVFDTRNGPLVPLLAVPFLVVGPRTVATAMMIQPVLVAVTACGAAGAVSALGHRRSALLAGVVVLGMPVSVVSSRSFQYSLGVGAFLMLATWALLASRRGERRIVMLGFGAAVGCMLLSRTMSAGFLPGIGLASLLVVGGNRRGLRNLGLAVVAALVVAGPWWLVQWRAILDYLTVNAYGERAHYWGSVGLMDRVGDYRESLDADFLLLLPLGYVTVAAVTLVLVVRRLRGDRLPDGLFTRELGAVWIVVVLSYAALLSTSNRGFWFAQPVEAVLVVGVVGLVARLAPSVGFSRVRWSQLVAGLACALVLVGYVAAAPLAGSGGPYGEWSWRELFAANLDSLQFGNLEADRRFASPDFEHRRRAAVEWEQASRQLAREVDVLGRRHGPLWQSVTGEIHLFNANTIGLTQEASRIGIHGIEVINTLEPTDSELVERATPFLDGVPRVLVIIDGRSLPFPDGRGQERLIRIAEQEGWDLRRRIPLPDGGDVSLYVHPESLPLA